MDEVHCNTLKQLMLSFRMPAGAQAMGCGAWLRRRKISNGGNRGIGMMAVPLALWGFSHRTAWRRGEPMSARIASTRTGHD